MYPTALPPTSAVPSFEDEFDAIHAHGEHSRSLVFPDAHKAWHSTESALHKICANDAAEGEMGLIEALKASQRLSITSLDEWDSVELGFSGVVEARNTMKSEASNDGCSPVPSSPDDIELLKNIFQFPEAIEQHLSDCLPGMSGPAGECLACDILHPDLCSACEAASSAAPTAAPTPVQSSPSEPASPRTQAAAPLKRRVKKCKAPTPTDVIKKAPKSVGVSKIVSAPKPIGEPDKRYAETHKHMERQRRQLLRESMDRLRETLSLPNDTVEAQVLSAALKVIRDLENEHKDQMSEMDVLRGIHR
jgi:hypothetical protein